MYPSDHDALFGVFVKNFKEKLMEKDVEFSAVSVIRGKRNSKMAKLKSYSKYYLSVLENYRKSKFDIIYIHFLSHNAPILYLILRLFGKKNKWVVNVHGSDIVKSHGKRIDILNRFVLKNVDLVVVPSGFFKELMLKNYPFLQENQLYISPSGGVDKSTFYPSEGKSNTIPVLGMISRIDEGKGWEVFIKSLALINKNGISFKAIIAGQGLEEAKLKELIHKLDLDNCVDFKGLVEQSKLIDLYKDMDVLVFPTHEESLGLVGVEAMSCGIPVIGSDIPALKSYISDTKNGFLFPVGNVKQLSEKIMQFLKMNEEAKIRMSEHALHTAQAYEATEVINRLYGRLQMLCSVR